VITDVVSVFGSADNAAIALAAARGVAPDQLTNAQPRDLPGGQAFVGSQDERGVTIALFTEGRAFVTVQFRSSGPDPVGFDIVTAVVAAQAARIETGLS